MTAAGTRTSTWTKLLVPLALLLVPGRAAAQAVPGVREAEGQRLPPEVTRKLAAGLPGGDGWTAEAAHAAVGAVMRELKRWIGDPSLGSEELLPLVTAEPRFALPDVAHRAEAERSNGWSTLGVPDAAEERTGRAELAQALRDLFPGARIERFELKTYGVREDGEVVREEARLHAAGGDWELVGTWDAGWRRPADGGPPRLDTLRVSDVSLVRGRGPRFVDRTRAVLGATQAWRTELAYGLDHWRRRLDTRLGLPILGHPAGVAVADVDGDELEDLFLCQPGGLANRLFLRRPDGAVVDVSARAGVDHLDFARAALLLDFDRDGDRDLAVVLGAELVFFSNRLTEEAHLRFEEAARFDVSNATSLAAADHDLDGDLDLYVCCYFLPYDGGAVPVPYHDARNGARNLFLVNEGGWSFRDATDALGLGQNNDRFSFAASWEDYDSDGDPDLYVANDFGRNNLYRNDDGRFVDVAALAGVEDLAAGMGVAWGDVDGDGDFDLYVSNMYSSAGKRVTYQRRFHEGAADAVRGDLRRHALGNTLFLNRGDGTFRDATADAGVAMGRWAWGSVFLDFDNDARLDLFVPNGFLTSERNDDL